MPDNFGDFKPGDLAHLYNKRIHSEDEASVDQITLPKNWDFANFKRTIIACSRIGEGNKSPYYIPAKNVPETIHMGNLRKYIDELNGLSQQTGHELSRVFMTDTRKSELIAGKKVEGNEN